MRQAVVLQLKNKTDYQKNLDELISYIKSYEDAIIVAPEVCLTDYDYDNLQEASEFSEYALNELLKVVEKQIVALTLLRKIDGKYYNEAVILYKGTVVHTQKKHKLFKLGNEHHYLEAGSGNDIVKFEIDGIIFGLLICFELRYKELWKRLEGSDIILLPSQWGEPRKRHLEILSNALAVMNQCYVLVANSAKETMAKSSAIYAPMGGVNLDDASVTIEGLINFKQIKVMRKYIVIE